MDTKQLKTFRTIAGNLSFSKTAHELNYAQSTISGQIKSLENELRLTLFNRLGKKVVLTDEGKSVLEYANRFMSIEEEFIESLKQRNIVSGELNIYAPNSICVYLLPNLLTKYGEEFPNVNFRLRAHLGTKKALRELKAGRIDVMIIIEEQFEDIDLDIKTLKPEEIVFISNKNNPLAKMTNVPLEILKDQRFILTEPSCGYRAILTREFLSLGVKLNPLMWFDNAEAIKECVKSNMGISFLPKITVDKDIKNGLIKQIDTTKKYDNQIKLQVITHKDKWHSPALTEFISSLTTFCIAR